jgi:tryptophan 7-halogenase
MINRMIAVNGGVAGSRMRTTSRQPGLGGNRPDDDRIERIVIAGGGPAGWLAAATLARLLRPSFCRIEVIDATHGEPEAFSEATLPSFHRLNALLGIDEFDLLRRTQGTYSLGTEFTAWGKRGSRYFHAFGPLGARLDGVAFHHCWLRLRRGGERTPIDDYSVAAVMASQGKFAHPTADSRSVASRFSYGYQLDATSLAAYLKQYALAHGVSCAEHEIVEVRLRPEDGFIESLLLADGAQVCADLFVDCTGARRLLSGQALRIAQQDWSRWLPCDRAVAGSWSSGGDPRPYAQSIAHDSGWRWRSPLRQRVDETYVYASAFSSDDEAAAILLADRAKRADLTAAQPRLLKLTAGRPARFWDKNCLSLGAAGFGPLESTGLHLVQTGITRLVTSFPVCRYSPCDIEEYNRLTVIEHERIRDFLILHYKLGARGNSAFWVHCAQMDIPESLRTKIELFRESARIASLDDEHFGDDSWLSVFIGHGIEPRTYDPLADALEFADVETALPHMRTMIREAVGLMQTHAEFLARPSGAPP